MYDHLLFNQFTKVRTRDWLALIIATIKAYNMSNEIMIIWHRSEKAYIEILFLLKCVKINANFKLKNYPNI